MAITTSATSLKNRMDGASPNTLHDAFRLLKVGDVIRAVPTTLRKKAPAASPYNLATLHALGLPDDAKAHSIFRAYARAGAGTAGELAVQAFGATPAAGQIAVAPNGEIVTLAADAWTSLDVVYLPEKYDAFEAIVPVVPGTGVLTIPAALAATGVVQLLEAESLAGALVSKMIGLAPAAGAPATGNARLNLAKTTVQFAVADAVTSARVKFAIVSAVDVDALLEATSAVM